MTTQTQVKKGDYFYTSWGYDQTNIDYLVVVDVSSSGKSAKCRMAHPIHVGAEGVEDVLMPGEAWGITFNMKVRPDGHLRSSYPFCCVQDSKRLDTFFPIKFGETHNQTMSHRIWRMTS